MKVISANFTVADLCAMWTRGDIDVDPTYQRSNKVWPPAARSFLIETILLEYSMPKFCFHQQVDVRSKKTVKYIVDGQQRSSAIRDFFEGKLKLSKTLETPEIAGKTYRGIPEEYQARFLQYQLSVDLFQSATADEIRETFRRMNSYTIPLNADEKRHAKFQGPFKWLMNRMGKRYSDAFERCGLLGRRQIIRMADAKLFTEVCHSLVHGIKTTKTADLDAVYKVYDRGFPDEDIFEERLGWAFDTIISAKDLADGPLMKPHIVYAWALALIHAKYDVLLLRPLQAHRTLDSDENQVLRNLLQLQSDLATDDPKYPDFVEACGGGTNVEAARAARFRFFFRAITGDSLDA